MLRAQKLPNWIARWFSSECNRVIDLELSMIFLPRKIWTFHFYQIWDLDFFRIWLAFLLEKTIALPETNVAPENQWLEDSFPFGMTYFQVRSVSFWEVLGGEAKTSSRKFILLLMDRARSRLRPLHLMGTLSPYPWRCSRCFGSWGCGIVHKGFVCIIMLSYVGLHVFLMFFPQAFPNLDRDPMVSARHLQDAGIRSEAHRFYGAVDLGGISQGKNSKAPNS